MKIYWYPTVDRIYGFLDYTGNIYLSSEMCTINSVNSSSEENEENLRKKAF